MLRKQNKIGNRKEKQPCKVRSCKAVFLEKLETKLVKLFRTEDTVACITQTRADICVFIQLTIQMTNLNLYIGMCLGQSLKAFRSRDDGHELDVLSTVLFDEIQSGTCGTTGS